MLTEMAGNRAQRGDPRRGKRSPNRYRSGVAPVPFIPQPARIAVDTGAYEVVSPSSPVRRVSARWASSLLTARRKI
jgi:hypothetical protein